MAFNSLFSPKTVLYGAPRILVTLKTFAPIEQVLYDEVMVHGVPPDEKG
jgi:hypothetical protein